MTGPFVIFIQNSDQLEIGPYLGALLPFAHISIGRGARGTGLKKEKAIILNDVREHDDYISCDSETLYKMVILISMDDDIVAVLVVDSSVINGYDQIDKSCLGKLLSTI